MKTQTNVPQDISLTAIGIKLQRDPRNPSPFWAAFDAALNVKPSLWDGSNNPGPALDLIDAWRKDQR